MDALGVLENSDSKGFHNIIVNIFDMILEDAPMFLPRDLPQLEPNIFFKLYAPFRDWVSKPVCFNPNTTQLQAELLILRNVGLCEVKDVTSDSEV